MLSDGEIQSLLATPNFDTTLVSRELVKAANSAGGQDNTTVIVANVVQGQKWLLHHILQTKRRDLVN